MSSNFNLKSGGVTDFPRNTLVLPCWCHFTSTHVHPNTTFIRGTHGRSLGTFSKSKDLSDFQEAQERREQSRFVIVQRDVILTAVVEHTPLNE